MILANSGSPARAVIAVMMSKRTAPFISAREASAVNGAVVQVVSLIYYIASRSGRCGASRGISLASGPQCNARHLQPNSIGCNPNQDRQTPGPSASA
jgi:hypothetical protein